MTGYKCTGNGGSCLLLLRLEVCRRGRGRGGGDRTFEDGGLGPTRKGEGGRTEEGNEGRGKEGRVGDFSGVGVGGG